MRLLCLLLLLSLGARACADDLEVLIASKTSASKRGAIYERLSKADFAPMAWKLARLRGSHPMISSIAPKTEQPWGEDGLSEADRVAFTLFQLWNVHLENERKQDAARLIDLMLSIVGDPFVGARHEPVDPRWIGWEERLYDGRDLALREIAVTLRVNKELSGADTRAHPSPVPRILERIATVARDPRLPRDLRASVVEFLTEFGDVYQYRDIAGFPTLRIASHVEEAVKREDVSLTISLGDDKKPSKVELPLDFTLVNHGAEPISIFDNARVPLCSIEITDDKGQACAYTNSGLYIFEYGFVDRGYDVKIDSGQSKQWTIPLEEYFKLYAGTFTLKLTATIEQGAGTPHRVKRLTVPPIHFQVTTAPQ